MTLIICPECEHEISDRAESCIKCGFPLDSEATTIEQTSKRYKGNLAVGFVAAAFGAVLVGGGTTGLGWLLVLGGVVMMVWAKVAAWWHHA